MTQSKLDTLPSGVAPVVRALLDELDKALRGQVTGLHLVGSLALADYRPGQSDIDFIAITESDGEMPLLAEVHATLAREFPGISCDGIYVQRGDLRRPAVGSGPSAREGKVEFASRDERHAVNWLTLLQHGITARGDEPSSSWINADPGAAAEYSRKNLKSYWVPWLAERRRDPDGLLDDWSVMWGCLGVGRLHAAIVEGEMVSKTGGGVHALARFPRHQAIIREALRLRQGAKSHYPSPIMRMRDLVKLMEELISSNP